MRAAAIATISVERIRWGNKTQRPRKMATLKAAPTWLTRKTAQEFKMSQTSTAIVPLTSKQEIKNYLIQGIPHNAIAQALGVDPSYVSQLLNDEEFAQEVQNARMMAAAQDSSVDQKIKKGEETALDRVLAKLPMAGLKDSLYVFKVLNAAKLRKDSIVPQTQQASTGTVVEIYLPGAMIPQYVQNKKSEIIEVEGKTMISAGAKQLERMHQAKVGAIPEDQTANRAQEMLEMVGGSREQQQTARPQRKDLAELLKEL